MIKTLLVLYVPLMSWVGLGWLLGWKLPPTIPASLGRLLFWIGVPLSTVGFLRHANLAGSIWIAPLAAWIAIFLGAGLAWLWLIQPTAGSSETQVQVFADRQQHDLANRSKSEVAHEFSNLTKQDLPKQKPAPIKPWRSEPAARERSTEGSFLLAAMVGNTGYLGYPIGLALVGPDYFAWTLFYDILGTALGAYGLGVLLAARFGIGNQTAWSLVQTLLCNPVLWSFGIGLCIRNLPLPKLMDQALYLGAWGSVTASLILLGMRLSQVSSRHNIKLAIASLGIKMLIVPLLLGIGISVLGLTGAPRLAIVLQMAMPPAFATLIISEAYHLDRELTVTTLALGSLGMLAMLPLWLWIFPL